jgi:NDP-hexose 2,3-enoyl reductase
MQHVKLGRTGLRVSRLCLGTMNFGPETAERESFAIMDSSSASTSSIPPTCTAGRRARG